MGEDMKDPRKVYIQDADGSWQEVSCMWEFPVVAPEPDEQKAERRISADSSFEISTTVEMSRAFEKLRRLLNKLAKMAGKVQHMEDNRKSRVIRRAKRQKEKARRAALKQGHQ